MEHPNSFPTSADYAMDSARTNEERIRRLNERVEIMEDVIANLLKALANFGNLCSEQIDNLPSENQVIKNWNRWG